MVRTSLTDPLGHVTQRETDRAGRLASLKYLSESPKNTPDVTFSYDKGGNRTLMSEANASSTVRNTSFSYDQARRLTSVGFDNDGNGSVDQTVSYQYDAGGLRTKLTLPGSLNVSYGYDSLGRLTSLADWDSQTTTQTYDQIGRVLTVNRPGTPSTLTTKFAYTPASTISSINHSAGTTRLAHYTFTVDARGNRTSSRESIVQPGTGSTTVDKDSLDPLYSGTWSTVGSYRETTGTTAMISILYFGPDATLTMGVGPDHGIYQYRLNGGSWVQRDGYAATAGDDVITLPSLPNTLPPNLIEIQNTTSKNAASTGNKMRFKTLVVPNRLYDIQTLHHSYDNLARVRQSWSNAGLSTNELRRFAYKYDVAGNRTQQVVTIAGSPTTTNYTYNAANQLTSDGAHTLTYDNNGNLTSDGVNSYTSYDRANRLTAVTDGTTATQYTYDGMGRRISQSVNSIVTQYLLDVQPGLEVVLGATTGSNTVRYAHGPKGIHAQKDASGNWEWMLQDGLGSVRQAADNSNNVLWNGSYEPYGVPFGISGTSSTMYGFTGEPTDANNLLYLRARYYAPSLGVFTGRDPFEGFWQRPMSLNGYSWVEGNVPNDAVGELLSLNGYAYANGNPVNLVDPNGMCALNNSSTYEQRGQCSQVINDYIAEIEGMYGSQISWSPDLRKLVEQELRYWNALPYADFVSQWNSTRRPASTDPGGQVMQSSLPILGTISFANPGPGPEDLIAIGGLCIAGIWALAANAGAITLPLRPAYDFSVQTYEFRLSGFPRQMKTLAEHLSKVLNESIAGAPLPDPNPDNRATRGWCGTIRRILQDFDAARYSENQLNRDLQEASIGRAQWNDIIRGVKKVVKDGVCNDYWDGFNGGSLAAG